MEKENVRLEVSNFGNEKDYFDLCNMMDKEDGIKEIFGGRRDRLMAADCSWMIKANDKNVGFINLVTEKVNHRFLFLDMGIIKAYRGKGYGKRFLGEVQKKLEESNYPEYVLMETKQDNNSANKISKDVGCYLTSFDDRNVYLLQRSRLQEFVDTNKMEELAKHYENGNSKRDIVKQYS